MNKNLDPIKVDFSKPAPPTILRAVLLKAADVMEKKGYNNYSRAAGDGSVCVLGAIEVATVGITRIDETPILKQIHDLINPPDLNRPKYQHAWNLADWSNHADGPTVIKALREAAQRV